MTDNNQEQSGVERRLIEPIEDPTPLRIVFTYPLMPSLVTIHVNRVIGIKNEKGEYVCKPEVSEALNRVESIDDTSSTPFPLVRKHCIKVEYGIAYEPLDLQTEVVDALASVFGVDTVDVRSLNMSQTPNEWDTIFVKK